MRFVNRDYNYLVTSDGRIYSLPRMRTTGGFIKPMISKTGYYTVMLGSNRRPVKLHRLVAEAFIPNPDNKPYVNHKDGNKLNNHVDNLEWCTPKENSHHAANTGLLKPNLRSYENASSKLSEEDVKWIKDHFISNDRTYGLRAMAKRFNVTKNTIARHLKWSPASESNTAR